MHLWAKLDQEYVWHPFTQMRDWLRREPIVLVRGKGAVLSDVHGRSYLDANSSIWTNLHGHRHPAIDSAIRRQLGKVAHTSALGFANEPASLLARELVALANPQKLQGPPLTKVFYSDDGSTAIEVALKLAYEFTRRVRGISKPRFVSLRGAYHGDTVGATSLGHVDLFHRAYRGLLFKSDAVMSPYCYRCPFNRAKPERADAREYRRCQWECVGQVEKKFARRAKLKEPYAALVVEPAVQGAAGMIAHPHGWLKKIESLVRHSGALLIADEVMTGFGRTGTGGSRKTSVFASHRESVQPDLLACAKGLTGGYLPMAATLTSQAIFNAFLGEYSDFKTFFHGHSFTGNPLGAAAALASLKILSSDRSKSHRSVLESELAAGLTTLWERRNVGDIRCEGLVVGVELVRDWKKRTPFDLSERVGIQVCEAMARRGVLTRPIGNVVVLMPPYVTTVRQVRQMISVLSDSIAEVCEGR